MKTTSTFAFILLTHLCTPASYADSFGTGLNTFDIEFVTIGNPGNAADTSGKPSPAGAVAHVYRIGKFEISEEMIDKANAATAATVNPLNITHDGRGANKPATDISWFEAVRFINWLNTSTGSKPAYKFDDQGNFQLWQPEDAGYDPDNLFRNRLATYFLPSIDEWYKAAYYDPVRGGFNNYATGWLTAPTAVASGTAPGTAIYKQVPFDETIPADITLAGGLSAYGTMAQSGNASEWQESENDGTNDEPFDYRSRRGGSWWNTTKSSMSNQNRTFNLPTGEGFDTGFRVAAVPEPHSLLLGALAFLGFFLMKSRLS